jgi:phospholipid N-methyltransferase
LQFTWAFVRNPGRVGALCPSGRWLAQAVISGADLGAAETVVELGPGTGAFTRKIVERMGRQTKYLGIELDPAAMRILRSAFPELHFHEDSAARLGHYLNLHGRRHADYIISGLPFANMPATIQRQIMEQVVAAMAPHSRFTTFAYLGGHLTAKGRSFRKLLQELFGTVETSPPILRNLPPAFVYRCSIAAVG